MTERVGRKAARAGLIACFCCSFIFPGATLAAQERPLTKGELAKLYEGNTWIWNDGSGYFGPSGRFVAIAGKEGNKVQVDGSWTAQKNGRLCFSGVWRSKPKARGRFDQTCFLHKTKDGAILQKRLPNGEWYVFRSDKGSRSDQVLVIGDVTASAGH